MAPTSPICWPAIIPASRNNKHPSESGLFKFFTLDVLEKHAVVFLANLGKEIYCRMRRIGDESETMACTCQRRHCDLNRRGILDVTSSKLLRRTTERYSSKDS